jgi:hypothetical protein
LEVGVAHGRKDTGWGMRGAGEEESVAGGKEECETR